MDERNLVSINKNKEPEIDTYGYYIKLLESFPSLERDVLKLRLGLGEPFEVLHTTDEIAEILNESKEILEKNLSTGLKRMRDNSEKERLTFGIPSETVNQLTAILFELETTLGPLTGHPYITHPSL